MTNAKGFKARRGQNNKFYCGRPSTVNCGECDGNCGPTNGCQCLDCLKLDRQFYNLSKTQCLNHNGIICEFSNNNEFYCGGKYELPQKPQSSRMQIIPPLRSYMTCEPYHNCPECKKMASCSDLLNLFMISSY